MHARGPGLISPRSSGGNVFAWVKLALWKKLNGYSNTRKVQGAEFTLFTHEHVKHQLLFPIMSPIRSFLWPNLQCLALSLSQNSKIVPDYDRQIQKRWKKFRKCTHSFTFQLSLHSVPPMSERRVCREPSSPSCSSRGAGPSYTSRTFPILHQHPKLPFLCFLYCQ